MLPGCGPFGWEKSADLGYQWSNRTVCFNFLGRAWGRPGTIWVEKVWVWEVVGGREMDNRVFSFSIL